MEDLTIEERKVAMDWANGRDTGLSSEAVWSHMLGGEPEVRFGEVAYPLDNADLGRCIRLLDLVPKWRTRISEMGKYNRHWELMSKRFNELEALYRIQADDGASESQRSGAGNALYAFMYTLRKLADIETETRKIKQEADRQKEADRPMAKGGPFVVLADPDADMRGIVIHRLGQAGFETVGASNVKELEVILTRSAPDLIIMDDSMSGMVDMIRRIKKTSGNMFIPIMVQAANDSIDGMIGILDAGADDYITKPINFSEMAARIRALIRVKKQQEELLTGLAVPSGRSAAGQKMTR